MECSSAITIHVYRLPISAHRQLKAPTTAELLNCVRPTQSHRRDVESPLTSSPK